MTVQGLTPKDFKIAAARSRVVAAARDYILLPPRGDDPRNTDRLYVLQKAVEALEEVTRENEPT